MKHDLVFATNNIHKAAEIQAILGSDFRIQTLKEIGCTADIDETASTLEGNALIKSDYVRTHFGIDCFADDTGLEVEALNGKPGVHSARYAGNQKNDQDNIQKLLAELGSSPHREARFRTVISLQWKGEVHQFEGILSGTITMGPRGGNGFGYDPVFQPIGFEQTLAQLTMDQKNEISHRARAFSKLIAFLTDTL